MNRREFLKQAAFVGGTALIAPTIVPSNVFGQGAPSNRINVVMIGCGRQTRKPNIPQLLASQNAQIVGVCDTDKWRLDNAVKQVNDGYAAQKGISYRGCDAYADFRDVMRQRAEAKADRAQRNLGEYMLNHRD